MHGATGDTACLLVKQTRCHWLMHFSVADEGQRRHIEKR
jgi:hypothetical protein